MLCAEETGQAIAPDGTMNRGSGMRFEVTDDEGSSGKSFSRYFECLGKFTPSMTYSVYMFSNSRVLPDVIKQLFYLLEESHPHH